jgi:3',5'-nucleoside bisphosphate phosphatase
VLIDLHTHSNRSDGTESPATLVQRAHTEGIDVLALTDHDSTEGWQEAAEAAERTDVTLVRGLEISCKFDGHAVHLLAYLPDPTYPPLADELDRVLDGRNVRLPTVLKALRGLGIKIDDEDVRRAAGDAVAIGRPHIADALVANKVVENRKEAFDTYLGPRGPAYVNRYAADLVTMIGTVRAAGGVTVIAHPWASRHNHTALDVSGFARLKDAGMVGIEVDHQDHDDATRAALRVVAADLDLVVTGSSDHHGLGKPNHDLGCNQTTAEQYERLIDLASAASAASGRTTPDVVAR